MRNIKNIFSKSILLGLVILSFMAAQIGIVDAKSSVNNREKTEFIIKYKDTNKSDVTKNALRNKFSSLKLTSRKIFKKDKIEIININSGDNLDNVIKELKKDSNVQYVQPNYKLTPTTVPSDARFAEQWALSNSGQEIEGQTGRSGVDINAITAWNTTTGSSSVVIGVLDTGIDINHEDLSNNIYTNTNEIPNNGIDDDANGYIDDVYGWDFVNSDNTVYDSSSYDSHGTSMAGIIAASSNNTGICGVAPSVKILPLKFISGESGYTSDAIDAIEYASSMGVKIINCSFGSEDNNLALKDAMQNSGILFVCAAGNSGTDTSIQPIYPAAFDISNVISTAAINNIGARASFSSFGSNVDVAAPGENILCTLPGNSYGMMSGTSAATAHVTGIAALIQSYFPTMSIGDIKSRIEDNVVVCQTLQGKVATNGRVDANAALTDVVPTADNYVLTDDETSGQTGSANNDDAYYQLAAKKDRLHYGKTGVNPATGNFSFTCTDMSVDAPGFEISISRTYNSKSDTSSSIGRGWKFGFEGSITGNQLLTVTLPTGSIETFSKNADGLTYTAEDSRSILTEQSDGTYILTTQDQYTYGFSASGWLIWMKDRNGNTVTIEVDDSTGLVQTITDGAGREYTVAYNSSDLIETITDPASRTVSYAYTNGLLTSVTDPMGNIMRYSYDSSNFLDEIRDHNNNLVQSLVYDHSGGSNDKKVSQVIDEFENTSTYSYDNVNCKTTITDANSRQYVYWYDVSGYILKTQDPEGKFTSTQYFTNADGIDKFGEERSATDRNGNITYYQWDENGNLAKQINPDSSYKEFTYDNKNNIIAEKDEAGKYTYYIYDTNKINLLKKVQPLNGADAYSETADQSKFAITSYSYYTNSEALQLGYKEKGLLKSDTDPEGNTTSYTYDASGNLKTETNPENKTTTYNYNNIGWKTSEISTMNFTINYTYDKNNLLEKTTLNSGETTRITYDQMGRKTKEVPANLYNASLDDINNHSYSGNQGYRYTYYSNGLVQTETDPGDNTTAYTYDQYGNVETETKPNGAVYVYEYDSMDRLKKKYFKEDSSAAPVLIEEYSYAILSDKKTQKTFKKYLNSSDIAITVFKYDYADRLIEQQNPDGTKIKNTYNPNGTLTSSTAANGSTTYNKYDGLNRLVETWTPFETSGTVVKYSYSQIEYDKAGRKITERTGKSTVNLYDIPSEFVSKTYEYYLDGKVKSASTSSGAKIEYQYDNDGNLSKQDTYTSSTNKNTVEYVNNHFGKPTEMKVHVKEGDIAGNSFDSANDMILSTTFTYDNDGNVKTETMPDGTVITYSYDNMDRNTGASQPGIDEYGNAVTISTSTIYNWDGNKLSEADANGNTTTYEYDKKENLTKIIDANSKVTAYAYDIGNRKIIVVSPKNYDSTKDITEMNRTEYVYDLMGREKAKIQKYTDPVTEQAVSIATKAYKYDNDGNVIKELDALGYQSGSGSTVDEKINSGYGIEYTYNLADKMVTILDPVSKERSLSYTTRYAYDALGRKVTETNAKGAVKTYYYDDSGNVIETTIRKSASYSEQALETNTYNLSGNITSKTDGNGNTISYEYNAFGKVRKVTYPSDATLPSRTVTNQYDIMANLKRQEDTAGKVNIFTYDNMGRELTSTEQKTDGTEAITTITKYDKNGNKRFEINGNNVLTENTFDALDRKITSKVTVGGIDQITTNNYDEDDNLLSETDWRGNTLSYVYNPLDRLIQKIDQNNKTIERLEYNANGAQSNSYDALGHETQYSYDKNNRLISTQDAEGHITSQAYDNAGNIKSKTDGRGKTSNYGYNELNRLVSVTNASSETTTYTYDLNNNMLTQKDGKNNISYYEYNCVNKLIGRIDAGGRTGTEGSYEYNSAKTETYTYFADGSLATKVDRNGKTTNYTYDSHGKMLSESIGTLSVTYTYDNNGNQLTMTDSTGTTTREYDELNRTISKTVPNIGETTFEYDITTGVLAGYVAETTTDPKGNITEKVYDKVGRLQQIIAGGNTTTYDYYNNGNKKEVVYQNGAKEEYTYYDDNLLETLVNKKANGTVAESFSYTYDEAHNQTSKVDVKGTTAYTYDNMNRLKTITEPDGKVTAYTYDAAGNRLTQTVTQSGVSVSSAYTYNEQNRLLEVSSSLGNGAKESIKYTYDNNGNLLKELKETTKPANQLAKGTVSASVLGESQDDISKDVSYYAYDDFNQMVKANAGANSADYIYDGEGNRIAKNSEGQVTRYLYEGDKVILETDGAGNQTAWNVQGTNLVSRTVDGQTANYFYNGHGDVTLLLDNSGQQLASYYYDAFGNPTSVQEDVYNPYRYAEYQYDNETGLYYLMNRMYDPVTARFLQEDSYRGQANDPLSLNLYTYCHNEPLMYIDPDGHAEKAYYINDKKISETAEYATGIYGNLNDIAKALNTTVTWNKNRTVATIKIYNKKKKTNYFVRYDLSKINQSDKNKTSKTVNAYRYDENNSFIDSSYGVYMYKGSYMLGNVHTLAKIAGVNVKERTLLEYSEKYAEKLGKISISKGDKEELLSLDLVNLLARTIYAEQTSSYNNAQNAVAWTMINRILSDSSEFVRKKKYEVNIYNVITKPSAYSCLDGEGGNWQAYTSKSKKDAGWKNAVKIAINMVNVLEWDNGNRDKESDREELESKIKNPIGKGCFYRADYYFDEYYNKKTKKLKNKKIKDIKRYGGNVFFNYDYIDN
ncbi:MAG: S8 family serine peptidase [Ignavibacteriales bacterium]